MYPDDFLSKKLLVRVDQNALRVLQQQHSGVDFFSNDYLGLAHNSSLSSEMHPFAHGATGSRLLSGNYNLIMLLEEEIATFHQSNAALIFNSGYDANIGLLAAVPQRGDTILYDYLCHASLRDGIRLSFAQSYAFMHNDLDDLNNKLKKATGNIFVVTESVFSMDGDLCPLPVLVTLCKQYHAHLIVDEAHATGVLGDKGEGYVQQLQLQDEVFARVHTFGKAVGCHGAVVLGSQQLKSYLINFARSFVYTTALPEMAIAAIRGSYALFPSMQTERVHIQQLIARWQESIIPFEKLQSNTPIQGVLMPGNDEVKKLANHLEQNNLLVRPILYPTVPRGQERLRIVLHAFNRFEDLDRLIRSLQEYPT